MDNEKVLDVRDLTVEFKSDKDIIHAVNGVNLSINKGETLGLVGETGAGKTTTALAIMGIIPTPPGKIVSGEIKFSTHGDLLKKKKREMRQIRGSEISMIFQDPMTSLNPAMTVGDQIAEMVKLHSAATSKQAEKKAKEMLELVGIPGERSGEYPHQFSGGMKQRVMIAIALACNPQLLIADEPTTALDVTIQAQVLELMNDLKRNIDTAILLITHDLGVVAETCEKVAIMYAGEIVETGTVDEVFEDPKHPYTIGLVQAIPDISETRERLYTIQGSMADPADLPSGCRFHPRCPDSRERCKTQEPVMAAVSSTHGAKCHRCLKEETT